MGAEAIGWRGERPGPRRAKPLRGGTQKPGGLRADRGRGGAVSNVGMRWRCVRAFCPLSLYWLPLSVARGSV